MSYWDNNLNDERIFATETLWKRSFYRKNIPILISFASIINATIFP